MSLFQKAIHSFKSLKNCLIASALMLGVTLASAQVYPKLLWQKFYGKAGNDYATSLEKSADGFLLLGGQVQEENGAGPGMNIWIVKVDLDGEQIWEREIGGSGMDELRDMIATPDSGVIFVGVSSSFITHPEKGEEGFQGDYLIGKLDRNGNIVWLQSYGGLDIDQANCIAAVAPNNYVVGGASPSHSFDVETDLLMTNLWIPRIDSNGNKISAYCFGGQKHDIAFSAWTCKNGDVVFAGFTDSDDIDESQRRENGDGWVLRIDRFGTLKWQNVFSGKFEDYFQKVAEDKEGRIIVAGNFESDDKSKQFWLMKLTAEGKRVSEKIFGEREDEFLTGLYPMNDGGIILTGYSAYNSLDNPLIKGGEDVWLIRMDNRANITWKTTYGGPEDERGVDVVEGKPGEFYVLGYKKNDFLNDGTYDQKNDFWLLKVKEQKCEDIRINIYTSLKDYSAFVNRSFKCKAEVRTADSYLWDFGDGTFSTEAEPVKTYTTTGVYELKLTVFFNQDCSKTFRMPGLIMVW